MQDFDEPLIVPVGPAEAAMAPADDDDIDWDALALVVEAVALPLDSHE